MRRYFRPGTQGRRLVEVTSAVTLIKKNCEPCRYPGDEHLRLRRNKCIDYKVTLCLICSRNSHAGSKTGEK